MNRHNASPSQIHSSIQRFNCCCPVFCWSTWIPPTPPHSSTPKWRHSELTRPPPPHCTVMKLATAGHLKPYGNAKTMSFRSAGTWNSRKIRGTRACRKAKVHRNAHPSLLLPISYCHKITITMGLWVKTITKKLKTLKVNQVQRRFAPPFYRW